LRVPKRLLLIFVFNIIYLYLASQYYQQYKLSLHIKAIQKRAIKIIFECTRGMSYFNSLYFADLSSLQHRRQRQARDFFQSILDPNSCFHSLLPAPRDQNVVARLRVARQFPALASRTKKYQSFINFGLLKYQ